MSDRTRTLGISGDLPPTSDTAMNSSGYQLRERSSPIQDSDRNIGTAETIPA